MKLTGELLVENMTDEEKERAELVESLLPALRDQASDADLKGEFFLPFSSNHPHRKFVGTV